MWRNQSESKDKLLDKNFLKIKIKKKLKLKIKIKIKKQINNNK